jgi:hypothetical protein
MASNLTLEVIEGFRYIIPKKKPSIRFFLLMAFEIYNCKYYLITPNSFPTFSKAANALSKCAVV